MTELLTPEMKEQIRALATLVKEDKRTKEYERTADVYNKDTEILKKITEYNVNQTALTEEFAKNPRDEQLIGIIRNRIDVLYGEIVAAESYLAFVRAKEEYDVLLKAVTDELEYGITGRRACTHDCSSCHADCASKSADTDSASH